MFVVVHTWSQHLPDYRTLFIYYVSYTAVFLFFLMLQRKSYFWVIKAINSLVKSQAHYSIPKGIVWLCKLHFKEVLTG